MIGGIIATVILSIFNLPSNDYVLTVEYSSDPNSTESQAWLQGWPSLSTSKVRAICQPANIPLNTKLLTNNTALTYALTEVRRDASDDDDR